LQSLSLISIRHHTFQCFIGNDQQRSGRVIDFLPQLSVLWIQTVVMEEDLLRPCSREKVKLLKDTSA